MEWQDLTDIRAEFYGTPESRETIRKGAKLINEYLEAGWELNPPEEEMEIQEEPDDHITTPASLLKSHNLPADKWKVTSYRQPNMSFKPIGSNEINLDMIQQWFRQFAPKPVRYTPIAKEYGSGENVLLLPVVDLHYNLLATKFITGKDYNCRIARDLFLSVIDDVLTRIKGKKISKIIFPIGNDLFNANGINGMTFKGTPQNNEKHIFEAYIELYEVIVSAISKLASVAPVDVVYIPSNHDKEITFYFVHNLATQFRNDSDRVTVDYSPTVNKYRRVGNTLLMFSHDGKMDKLGNIALDEAGDMLYGAKYVEVFIAHKHSECVKNDRRITVRILPTISGRSAWTCEQGYGANSVCESFIINNERNITDILYTMV